MSSSLDLECSGCLGFGFAPIPLGLARWVSTVITGFLRTALEQLSVGCLRGPPHRPFSPEAPALPEVRPYPEGPALCRLTLSLFSVGVKIECM